MNIGIPKEIKPLEGRVSLTPDACHQLVEAGHQVYIEKDAGLLSGYSNTDYQQAGCNVLDNAAEVYATGKLIVKVKEPVDGDLKLLKKQHLLFCFLHLAAETALMAKLQTIGLTAVAFETVQTPQGELPLLLPMSVIAGRLAGQIGATLLHETQQGKGILLGGIPTTERGNVVVLGAGNAGAAAIDVVASLGANVKVFDLDSHKLTTLQQRYANVTGLKPNLRLLQQAVSRADLLIGAVLVAGARAPVLISKEMVQSMQAGSVVIDIAVDQGGCIETTHPTTYEKPTYRVNDITHFAVTNMPGAVPRTSTQALSAAILPYVEKLADDEIENSEALAAGINIRDGKIVHPALMSLT